MTTLETRIRRAASQWSRVSVAMLVERLDVSEEKILACAKVHRIPISHSGGTAWLIGKPSGRPVRGPQGIGKARDV